MSLVLDLDDPIAVSGVGAEPKACRNVRQEADDELLRLAGKGHDDAWEELVRRFGGLVHRVAKRSGLNDSDAADVAQTTWLRLMTHIDQLRDPPRIAGWLATTARRESVRVAIRGARQVLSADPLADDDRGRAHLVSAGADAEVLRTEYDPAVEAALARLPSQYRRLLGLLTCSSGPTYAEIAAALGVSIGSIGPMRLRALQQLRRDLEAPADR